MQEEYYDAQAEQYYRDEYEEGYGWDNPNGYWEVEEDDQASEHSRAETEYSFTGTARDKLALAMGNLTTQIRDLKAQQAQQVPAEATINPAPTARVLEPPKTRTKPRLIPCSVEDIMIRAQELANEQAAKNSPKQPPPMDARGTSPPRGTQTQSQQDHRSR